MKRPAILGMTGAVVALVALSGSVMAAGPVFQNGGFEDGSYTQFAPPVDFGRVSAPSTDIAGWNVTQGSVDWIGGYWQSAQGTKSLDLDGDEGTPGAISQTINTSVNSTYVVTFSMSGNPDSGPALKTMTVGIGAANYNETYDTSVAHNTLTDMKWATRTHSFVATSTQTTLSFTSTTPGGYGPALDNVVITETLATGANCKKGGWESMIDKTGTHFRNQGDCVSYYATGEKNLAF